MGVSAGHVVLLGDSILDNAAYTGGAPDVVTHLRGLLPRQWNATLCAVDGATAAEMAWQLERVPGDVTDVVLAIGGNDALQSLPLLSRRVETMAEALGAFADPVRAFEGHYQRATRAVVALNARTVVCTIYNGALPGTMAIPARMGLAFFNDVILSTAAVFGLRVLELRRICTEPGDYANPIEPSGTGGFKIASAVADIILNRAA
jgi:hypothetical protein